MALVPSPFGDVMIDPLLDELLTEIDSEDYLLKSKALTYFKQVFGKDANLMSACLELKMAIDGSGHPLTREGVLHRRQALKSRLDVWGPNRNAFDQAVFNLVEITLAYRSSDPFLEMS